MGTHSWMAVGKGRWLVLALVLAGLSSGVAVPGAGDPLEGKRVTLNLQEAYLHEIVRALNEQLHLPVCMEFRPVDLAKDKSPRFTINIKAVSAREALDTVAAITGAYVWRVSGEPLVVNLVPRDLLNDPTWVLNRKCPGFKVEDKRALDAIDAISGLIGLEGDDRIVSHAPLATSLVGRPGEKWEDHPVLKFYRRRITATIKAGTVRDVLNEITSAMGDAWWIYSELQRGDWRRNTVNIYTTISGFAPQPDASVPPAE